MDATEAAVRVTEVWGSLVNGLIGKDTYETSVFSPETKGLFQAASDHLMRVFKESEPKPVMEPCEVKHPYGYVCGQPKGHDKDHYDAKAKSFWKNDADDLKAQPEPTKLDPRLTATPKDTKIVGR